MRKKARFSLTIALEGLAIMFLMRYAANAAEMQVNKEEFEAKCQKVYEELLETDPALAETFKELTIEEFRSGNIKYTPEDGQRSSPEITVRFGQDSPEQLAETSAKSGPLDEAYWKDKGLSENDIAKIIEAVKVIRAEAAKIEWDKLNPDEAKVWEKYFADRFEEMTGYSPNKLFGPPAQKNIEEEPAVTWEAPEVSEVGDEHPRPEPVDEKQ